jgi:DNA-binding NarL/FixJ family response regulator
VTAADRRVLLVEDHRLTSQTVAFLLGQQGIDSDIWLGADLVVALASDAPMPATLVLLDLDLDDGIDGAILIPGLLARGCVVIVCSAESSLRLAACLESGASGVVPKASSASRVVDAVVRGLNGDRVMPEAQRADMLAELRRHRADEQKRFGGFADLSEVEAHVMRSLANGIPPAAIAANRGVSVKTVRHQVEAILMKVGANSQLQAVTLAHRAGWLDGIS